MAAFGVLRDGLEVNLSPKEYRLLELFMQHPRRVFSRDKLLEQVWGVDYFGDSKTVDSLHESLDALLLLAQQLKGQSTANQSVMGEVELALAD